MHLVSLCNFFWQKLQIRGSQDLQFLAISDIFFQILRILCSKNAFNWFWSTKFAYRGKKLVKINVVFRLGIALNLGGRVSYEFAIFAKFFFA